MNLNATSHWIQISASIGVIVGLIFVYMEIRQSHEIMQAQLVDGVFTMLNEQGTAAYGEQLHLIYEKACVAPESLTTGDLFVLDAFFGNVINRLRRNILISEESSFYTNEPWRQYTGNINVILRTHAGRHWWHEGRSWLEPDLVEVGDEILRSLGEEPHCGSKLSGYQEYLASARAQTNE